MSSPRLPFHYAALGVGYQFLNSRQCQISTSYEPTNAITHRVSTEGNAIDSVGPTVCTFVSTLLNQLIFDLDLLQLYGSWLKVDVKVKGQNAVTGTSGEGSSSFNE